MNSVEVLTNHSMLVDASGAISSIVPSGAATDALEHSLGGNVAQVVDCEGKCVLPGFVDGHTHAIFAGDRSHEHAMKLAGASYEEVEVRPK
jgi:imidazolonepropionase